ncbi:MAG: NAD(P)-binding domain-containing protein [Alphaproteobacteria bacterium]|nr:NAD(P)-binding domain-containing protein [Alphaproteobacteria bacterium]
MAALHSDTNARAKRIAVIGAGASGLCVSKYLLQAGFDVTIFEIGTQIGGLWCYQNDNGRSSCYRTLHINTSKGVTHFHDFDFAPDVQAFPDHRDMHAYLKTYADHFGVTPHIRFKTPIAAVRPAFTPGEGEPLWEVETAHGEILEFDTVIACTGHLTKPLHVPMFQNDFTGEYVHSHDYREPGDFVGKRICVVGVGNSGCDIVSDVCVPSPRTVLVARSGVQVLPKLFFGLPFTDITNHLQRDWIPDWLRSRLIRFMTYAVHGDMTKLGFKPLTERAHVTSNATVVGHIAYRRIEVKQGIDRIDGKTVHFSDGTAEEFDTLIAATGYLIDLPYLSPAVLPIVDNTIDLYQRIAPPGLPGLYFMGMFNTNTALNMIYEYQARWIRAIEAGEANLPPDDEMRAAIEAKRRWAQENYKASPRHTIEEEVVPYRRDLRRSLKRMRSLARRGA